MVDETIVSNHYDNSSLLELIHAGISKLGKSNKTVTVEDLAPVDEFHIGGRVATDHLMNQLTFSQSAELLDIGCGLGGASRFIAKHYGNKVTGIDLTDVYVSVGKTLTDWVDLKHLVSLHQGSALDMPFNDMSFDGAYMLHVGMNIQAKGALFTQTARVLKPGAKFGVYDVMRTKEGNLSYPVPWASDESFSFLSSPEEYSALLQSSGFTIEAINDRREFALEFFKQLKEKSEASKGPPALGLHLLMQHTSPEKMRNMISNIANGLVSPTEIIAKKI
ncbi:methyltransferase domain-containing protein [Pontibacter sp. JAM-7]|uniref:methyltransferase domain-containing protein n=1 Tax=Pontibacter sp. JAM-7 TaxID=3366581 RepID=UPI003AF82043